MQVGNGADSERLHDSLAAILILSSNIGHCFILKK